ncbi:MAG TPA: hypothetical protein VFU94_11760 [Conexibacter sp.]|nr:hypothetical protein [Conexibacter sp.]
MTNEAILLIAGPAGRDDELVAAAGARRPRRVTVLVAAEDPRRDRLARLLTAVEQATGATVVGLVAEASEIDPSRFDAVVGDVPLPIPA